MSFAKFFEKKLPHTKPDITKLYSETVIKLANNFKNPVIVDIGGGRLTPFANKLNPKHKLIVLDIDENELKFNKDADEKIIMQGQEIPLKINSADLIVSRYTLEHFNNPEIFIKNSYKILKSGGYSIHLFSCKYALFAIINQLIPNKLSQLLLNKFVPNSKHIRGYKTYYNQCYYSKIIDVFKKSGFEFKDIFLSYYQSRYFSFFLPFYLLSIFYEFIIYSLGIKNLSAYILIIVKKT